jgi:hypothetical protein
MGSDAPHAELSPSAVTAFTRTLVAEYPKPMTSLMGQMSRPPAFTKLAGVLA